MITFSSIALASVLTFASSFELTATSLQNRRIPEGCHSHGSQAFSSMSENVMVSRSATGGSGEVDLLFNGGIGRKGKSFNNPSRVYLRFSPLVGGPKFLPIHVEVMFLDYQEKDDTPYEILHRFDFLPAHPNDERTIINLLSLRSVPGLVRHRILVSESNEKNVFDENISFEGGTSNGQIVSVPSERIAALIGKKDEFEGGKFNRDCSGDGKSETDDVTSAFNIVFQLSNMNVNDIKFTVKEGVVPVRIPQEVDILLEEKNGMELHLLFNNCYVFALDVLKSLK